MEGIENKEIQQGCNTWMGRVLSDMNNLVRGELKHLTTMGGDMDSVECVLTGTSYKSTLLFIPYIPVEGTELLQLLNCLTAKVGNGSPQREVKDALSRMMRREMSAFIFIINEHIEKNISQNPCGERTNRMKILSGIQSEVKSWRNEPMCCETSELPMCSSRLDVHDNELLRNATLSNSMLDKSTLILEKTEQRCAWNDTQNSTLMTRKGEEKDGQPITSTPIKITMTDLFCDTSPIANRHIGNQAS